MTQHSRPQAGLFPGDGIDCGAYTANQWRTVMINNNRSGGMIETGAAAPPGLPAAQQFPSVGVYYATANRLDVSSPGAAQLSIDTGTAIVDGTHFINDTAITAAPVAVPAGVGDSRIDRVIVRQNYTGATYIPAYVPSLAVPANTARITVISGAEAAVPVAPTLTQDEDRATYWDIPLSQYTIVHTTGAMTGADQREWVDASEQCRFAQFVGAWDALGATEIGFNGCLDRGLPMPNGVWSVLTAKIQIPENYILNAQVTPVFILGLAGGAANVDLSFAANWGECGESYAIHNTSLGPVIIAVGMGTTKVCPTNLTLDLSTFAEPCDTVTTSFVRRGDTDTFTDPIYGFGIILEYLGWGRR